LQGAGSFYSLSSREDLMADSGKKNIIIFEKLNRNPVPELQKHDMVSLNELLGEVRKLWIAGNISAAIEGFRERGAHADLGKLYHAYLWLKDEIRARGSDYEQQLNLFNSVFLSVIEERGAIETDLYVSVLKDSPEYRFFSDHVKKLPAVGKSELFEIVASQHVSAEPEKKVTLKDILYSDDESFKNCSIELWNRLLHEYFDPIIDEKLFIAESGKIINKVKNKEAREPFHFELLIVYAIERLSAFKALSVESKDYAMKLVNMMSGSNKIWQRLHREYLLIIRKPSPSDSKRRVR
jgi:hypothetical protein